MAEQADGGFSRLGRNGKLAQFGVGLGGNRHGRHAGNAGRRK
jgi:hypothetical protein